MRVLFQISSNLFFYIQVPPDNTDVNFYEFKSRWRSYMLAKKLELKSIAVCKLQRPEVPFKIKKECEAYIKNWNESTFEENVKINSPPRPLKSPPRSNALKSPPCRDDEDSITSNNNIEYFVNEEEKDLFTDFDLSPLKGSPCIGRVTAPIKQVVDKIAEEQIKFGDKLLKFIEFSIDFQNDLKKKKRYIVWMYFLWEKDGYQWYRYEGLQKEIPYTTCAVCNNNAQLLRAIYKYEEIEQPALYLPCPPDTGMDLQPNNVPATKKKTSPYKKKGNGLLQVTKN